MARKKRDFDYMVLYPNNANYFEDGGPVFGTEYYDDGSGLIRSRIAAPTINYDLSNSPLRSQQFDGSLRMDKLGRREAANAMGVSRFRDLDDTAKAQFREYNSQVRDNNKQYNQDVKDAVNAAEANKGGGSNVNIGGAIGAAANNIATALSNPELKKSEKVATALGAPALAKIWSPNTEVADNALKEAQNRINSATNRYITDANDTQGAFSGIKENNRLNLINLDNIKQPTLKDFIGKRFINGATATVQGAASGSIGGPWGALGGAIIGTFGSLFGGIGQKRRARNALAKFQDDFNYYRRFAGNYNSFQKLNQQQSNENLLNNGLRQQRIQDLANINAYGGNLYWAGGETDPAPSLYDVGTSPLGLERMAYTDARFTPKQLTPISYGSKVDPNGEWAAAANYIADYDNQRMDLWHKNLDEINAYRKKLGSPYDYTANQLATLANETTDADKRLFMEKKQPAFNPRFDLAGTFFPRIARSNLSNVRIKAPEGDYALNPGAGGIYRNVDEENLKLRHTVTTNDKYLKDFDKRYGTNYFDTSKIHELAHSRGLDSFYEQIMAAKGFTKDWEKLTPEQQEIYNKYPVQKDKDGRVNRNYWLTPTEVISRRFEARKTLGLHPRDVVTKEFLEKPEVKKVIKDNHLDVFTNDQLTTLFNEIADNNNSKQYDNIAAMGGQFDFNLSPNMIDLQNQSLANQKYKYMNQMQPIGFTGGPGDKEPNPGFPRLACGGKLHLNKFDFGGSMNGMDLPTGMQYYENGGTHEENPNGGIQVGVDNQGTPNLVEEGEFRWGDYVFSNRIDVDLDVLSDFNVPATKRQGKKANKGKLSYADLAKKMAKKAGDLNDPITKDTLNENMKRASQAQDFQKAQMNSDNQLADYKNALKNQTQGNPMYGSMKYNGMGNVNQGLNEGSSAMEGVDNSSLSNVNRSGNAMMAAYGGNLYPDGGNIIISNQGVEFTKQPDGTWMSANGDTWSDAEMQQFVDNGEATMRPIHPALRVANDIVNRMNTPSYGGSNSFETTPFYAVPYFQNNPLGGLAGSGLATETKLRDLGMQKTYPIIGHDEEAGDIYMTPTGIRTSEQILNQPKNTDYVPTAPLNWNSQASNTMNPLYNIDVNLGFGQTQNGALGNGNIYNQQFGLGIRPDYVESKNPNRTVEAVSTYGRNVNGQIQYDPNGKPVMLYPKTFTGLNGEAANVDNKGFYKFGNTQNTGTGTSTNGGSSGSYRSTYSYSSKPQGLGEKPLDGLADNGAKFEAAGATGEGTTVNSDSAAVDTTRNLDKLSATGAIATKPEIPVYNTAGIYSQLGKGALKNIYNWAGLANTEFTPNNKPEQDLRALGKTGYVPRTADHSGMYRKADLFDINAANNAAQAQAAATARAMGNVNDRNQRAANQLVADYNAMLGVGNNYQTMFDTNMKSRLATDEYNKQTEQTNVAANNDMYRDNQNAGIQAKNFELSANTAANQIQWDKEQYADAQNRIAALNRQSDAARMADNQLNFLVDMANRNRLYNMTNQDPRQMYWWDNKNQAYQFKGDNSFYNNWNDTMRKAGIKYLDAELNDELNALKEQYGPNIPQEALDSLAQRQASINENKTTEKQRQDAAEARKAQYRYQEFLNEIRGYNPNYTPQDVSGFTTADEWNMAYNGLEDYYNRNKYYWLNPEKEKAYGGKIKTNKRNKNHSYDYMAI